MSPPDEQTRTRGYELTPVTIDHVQRGTKPRHIIHVSATDHEYETVDGLAFTLGVAALEAETIRDSTCVFSVRHPNGVHLYHVTYIDGVVVITKVAGS